ncbi:MAG: FAD-dependent oxidoreductase [Pseudomonadota bacterium]
MKISRRQLVLGGSAAITAPGIAGLVAGQKGVEVNALRDQSLWTTQVSSLPTFPQLDANRTVDLAVIGGGYTGLSCAYYVKTLRPEWNVVVLESHEVGSGASSRNTGAVYAKHVGVSDQGFADRGLDRLRKFIDDQAIDCDFEPAPTLMFTGSKTPPQLAAGESWLGQGELQERIGSDYYKGAILSQNFFKIQPAKLLAGHVNAAVGVGVEIFERSPALQVNPGNTVKIDTTTGMLRASQVMVATNAYTPRLGLYECGMYPLHQYSLATRKLSASEIKHFGLDQTTLRFEQNILPVTFSITPTGHFFLRMVLGYASFDSQIWKDSRGAKALAQLLFEQRYPGASDLQPNFGWHGVTGHTPLFKPIFGTLGDGNIHVSVAYNGLGIMPAHNSGFLSASRICGEADADISILEAASSSTPFPGDFYRSLMLKPVMNALMPV